MKTGKPIFDRRQFLRYTTAVSGLALAKTGLAQVRPCPPQLTEGATADCMIDAESDWQSRSTGAGVQWAHDFRADSEITYWLWAGGFGDDPNRTQSKSQRVTWDQSDGITGGGCLKILRAAGSNESADWWRPMQAMQESGRGVPDKGWAQGMPTIGAPNPSGGSRIALWNGGGDYGPASTGYDGMVTNTICNSD